MGLFTRDRADGRRQPYKDPLVRMMPYIMRSRTESIVYVKRTIDAEAIQAYIHQQRRQGRRISLFNIVVTALNHTIQRRPELNQFIMGRHLYRHRQFEVLYTVKQSLTDAGNESVAKVSLQPEDGLAQVTAKMQAQTDFIKSGALKEDDRFIRLLGHLPRFVLRGLAALLRWLDFHGWLPQALMEAIPFYASIFISHLGSLGADAPFHHLYEFGSSSIFLTIGRIYEAPAKAPDGGVEWRKVVDLAFTLDERICDGYYMVKSFKILERFLAHPEWLEQPALEPPAEGTEVRQTHQKTSQPMGEGLTRFEES